MFMLTFRVPNVAKKTSDVESDDNSNDNDWTYSGSRKCMYFVSVTSVRGHRSHHYHSRQSLVSEVIAIIIIVIVMSVTVCMCVYVERKYSLLSVLLQPGS